MTEHNDTGQENRTDHAAEYATAICDGLNSFLDHSEITLKHTIKQRDDGTEIEFSPTEGSVEAKGSNQYPVEDQGEHLEFKFDGETLTITGNVNDWSVFDHQLHTGEAVGCILESDETQTQ